MNLFVKIVSIPKWFFDQTLLKKIIIILIIVAGVWFIYGKFLKPKPTSTYTTAQVEKGTLVSSVEESGQVVSSNRVAITTQASGVINNVYVKDGDNVTSGEKIADMTLDSEGAQRERQAYASYQSAQNNLNSAQAKLNSLQANLFQANQTFINDKGISNPSDQQKQDPKYIIENANWLQAEADYKNQQSVIAAAQTALNASWLAYQAESPTIYAPSGGTITDIVIVPGLKITNSTNSTTNTVSSSPVASIKTEGNPIVSVNLSEVDSVKVKSGQKATITLDAFPDETFTGKLMGIDTEGSISQGVTSYPGTIVLDTQNDKILPNMSATADIITNVLDNVLLVPSAAVTTVGNQSIAYTQKLGQITPVNVTTGDSDGTNTQIKSGLSEGDTVLVGYSPTTSSTTQAGTSPFSRNIFGGGGGGNRIFTTGGGASGRGGIGR